LVTTLSRGECYGERVKTVHTFAVLASALLFAASSAAEAGPGRGGGGYRGGGHGGGHGSGSGARHYSGGHPGGSWRGHGHGHGGHYRPYWGAGAVFIGASYYAWPVYYAPSPAYYAPAPVTYVEQPAPPAPAYWYYCRELSAYYPQVPTCPGAWQAVAPAPPPN